MKISLIMPQGNIHRLGGIFGKALRYAPLTLTTLAASVPHELNANIQLLDEGVQEVNPDAIDADLVGITCITGTSHRAYDISARLRKRGIPTVIGGVHASLVPDEAQRHADAIVTGFAEYTWPQLLRDFVAGKMQPRYTQAQDFRFAGMPEPRRDLLDKTKYITMNTVQATRGCPWKCSFCVVPTAWPGYLQRPVAEVVAEVEKLPGKQFLFLDLSPTEDPVYIKSLYRALIPLKKHWGGLATMAIARDHEMLSLAAQSGCRGLLLGIESVNEKTIQNMGKGGLNSPKQYLEDVRRIHDAGIAINGCMVLGLDGDDLSVFEKTVAFVDKAGIDLPRFAVVTPFPNTTLHKQLTRQKRLLHERWPLYDAQHVVFKPTDMTPDQLQEGLQWTWKQAYSIPSIGRRLFNSHASAPLMFLQTILPVNLAYRFLAKYLPEFTSNAVMTTCEAPPPSMVAAPSAELYSIKTGSTN